MIFNYKPKQLRAAYKNVFSTEEGKLVLHDMLRRGHVFRTKFTGETKSTDFKLGEENHALGTMAFLNYRPEDFEELSFEAKSYLVGENTNDGNSSGSNSTSRIIGGDLGSIGDKF